MHDFYNFLYLGRLFIHLNIIIQVRQHTCSSIFFLSVDHNVNQCQLIISWIKEILQGLGGHVCVTDAHVCM